MRIRIARLSFALLLGARLASAAGVIMEFETRSSKDTKPMTGSVAVENDRMRMETGDHIMIFRGDKQVLWILQPAEGSYMEITKESLDAMAAQMAQAAEAMKNMPPEIKAKMEAMMAGKGGGAAPSEPETIKKLGKSETINGFPTEGYEIDRGGKKTREAWVTDWKRFDLKAADFAVFGQMAEFSKRMMGPFAKSMSSGFFAKYSDEAKGDTLPGVPIRTISYSDSGEFTHEIKKVSHESIAADKFEVPAGLKKKEMMPVEHGGPEGHGRHGK